MWKEKSSSSPTVAIGEATATTRSAMPSEKSAIRQPGTGWPRRASVRAPDRIGDRDERDRCELEGLEASSS